MNRRNGSGRRAGVRKRRGARDKYCRGWHCDFDSSDHCHAQRVSDLCDAHLPGRLAESVTESSRYQELFRHFQKTGQAEHCGYGCIVNIYDDASDCLCAYDACAYEALARAAAEGRMPSAHQRFNPRAPSAASCR